MISALRFVRPLGARGQVVIPRDIRKQLGLEKSRKVVFEVREGRVEVLGSNEESFAEEFFSLKRGKKSPSARELKAAIAQERHVVP